MLGMFCKLALRHVTTYANSKPEDGQKIEKSGIIIELMRMRDFCFVLRDRAKISLDFEMVRTDKSNGASGVLSSHEFMRQQANLSATASSKITEMPQEDFIQAFEDTFAKPLEATNNPSTQPNLTIKHSTLIDQAPLGPAAGVQQLQDQSCQEQNGHTGHINPEASMENIITQPVTDPQEFTLQEESGLWNWWDLIEMDVEGNMQMV